MLKLGSIILSMGALHLLCAQTLIFRACTLTSPWQAALLMSVVLSGEEITGPYMFANALNCRSLICSIPDYIGFIKRQ